MQSNLAEAVEATVRLRDQSVPVPLKPDEVERVSLALGTPEQEDVEVLTVSVDADPYRQTIETVLRTTRGFERLAEAPSQYTWGMCLRGGEETNDPGETLAHLHTGTPVCGGIAKSGYQAHPPWNGGVGYTFALYDPFELPQTPASFRCEVGKMDGSDPGDGILYKVEVVADGKATEAGRQLVTEHEWLTLEADLTPWAGQTVQVKVIADVGETDNSAGDWACWADMRVESREQVLIRALEGNPERYRREAGPLPIGGLTVADLRAATAGWIHYEGCGLSGTGEYGTTAIVNGIEVGEMAPAGGDETQSVYTPASVPLTPEAIRSLGRRNVFRIGDPRQDWFKVRRFWLELQLTDGRKCSSDISAATFTQPPNWPYAEGIGVPHGEDIAVDVWFEVAER